MLRALQTLQQDLRAVFDRDPAARNVVEVVLAYPGLHAIWLHRVAHYLHRSRLPVVPRVLSHFARWVTGIEIHPGACIGRRCFIDHGMGVVIGETAEIGDDVTLYQGVTLGIYHAQQARRLRGAKRHPTLRDGVIVGVGAKILGAITVGEGAIVAPGAVVTKDVPAHTTVMGIPARVVTVRDPQTGAKLRVEPQPAPAAQSGPPHPGRVADLPDPQLEVIRSLHEKIVELEARLETLEGARDDAPAAPRRRGAPALAGSNGPHRSRNTHGRANGVKAPAEALDQALLPAVDERGPAES
ncbi:MAG TPA: serine O-acetyltransferase [Chloroflexota bacterium]|nr:serine O-acetyltransferase [Chloroflexota bacterium]